MGDESGANFWRRASEFNGLGAKNCPSATAKRPPRGLVLSSVGRRVPKNAPARTVGSAPWIAFRTLASRAAQDEGSHLAEKHYQAPPDLARNCQFLFFQRRGRSARSPRGPRERPAMSSGNRVSDARQRRQRSVQRLLVAFRVDRLNADVIGARFKMRS
jgi:hypothetical protein